MTPKERRDSLFRRSRPQLRAFNLYDGSEYHRDLKVLWVAHINNPIEGISDSQEEFASNIEDLLSRYDLAIIEEGQELGIIRIADDGWNYEPHIIFFPWSTKRDKIRACVSGFQWARCSRKIGCVEVRCGLEDKLLMDHVCKYGVLHYVGKIVNGSPTGDVYIYSIKGKRNVSRSE